VNRRDPVQIRCARCPTAEALIVATATSNLLDLSDPATCLAAERLDARLGSELDVIAQIHDQPT